MKRINVFPLTTVEAHMLLNCRQLSTETAEQVKKGYLLARSDEDLKTIQKAVVFRADLHFAHHKFTESKRYMELAMRIRDFRTEMAKRKALASAGNRYKRASS